MRRDPFFMSPLMDLDRFWSATDNNTNNSEKADNSHNKNEAMISCPPEKELPPTTDTGNEDNDSESDNEEVAVDPNSPPSVRSSTTSTALTSSDVQKGVPQSSSSPSLATVTALAQSPLTEQNFVNPQGVRFQLEDEQEKQELRLPHKPYGVHGLVRLFRFLCSIINPKDINNTESMQFPVSHLSIRLSKYAQNLFKTFPN